MRITLFIRIFIISKLEILHQERRGQVNSIVMEHFNGILFHKSEPAYQSLTHQTS